MKHADYLSLLGIRSDRPLTGSPLVGLHCSGSDGSQWAGLWSRLHGHSATFSPDLIGTPSRGHLPDWRDFTLEQEASSVVDSIHRLGEPVHLVGHSYGGALALHIAGTHPDLVRSLCLYEPTLFSILGTGDSADQRLMDEIASLTDAIRTGIEEGFERYSAQVFTDFWGGVGAWQALNQTRRTAMEDWIEKAPADFHALLSEPEPGRIVDRNHPVSILVGSRTHPHTRRIAALLSDQSDLVRMGHLEGAGHLGPFTMRHKFERMVLDHIRAAEQSCNS